MCRFILLVGMIVFTAMPGIALAQDGSKTFPIISGTFYGPYEVVRPLFAILPISAGLLSNDPYEPMHEAMNKGFKSIEEFAKKNGGDAVVNTSIQVIMYTAIRPNGVMGQIVFYGTVIKQRPETKAAPSQQSTDSVKSKD